MGKLELVNSPYPGHLCVKCRIISFKKVERMLFGGRNGSFHNCSQNIELCAENLEKIPLLLFLYKENADKRIQIMNF